MNEVSAEKVNNLRDIILNRAGDERKSNLARGHKDAEAWLARENEKLQHEVDLVLQDARKRAEDIRRRQILSAERDKSTETLRLQNRILSEAMGRLQDKLVRLRDREDYADILAGMCIEAAEMLGVKTPLKLRLASMDAALAPEVIAKTQAFNGDIVMTADADPAPIPPTPRRYSAAAGSSRRTDTSRWTWTGRASRRNTRTLSPSVCCPCSSLGGMAFGNEK